MSAFREYVLPIAGWLLVCIVIALVGAGISMHQFSNECASSGGHVVTEGMTSWCRQ